MKTCRIFCKNLLFTVHPSHAGRGTGRHDGKNTKPEAKCLRITVVRQQRAGLEGEREREEELGAGEEGTGQRGWGWVQRVSRTRGNTLGSSCGRRCFLSAPHLWLWLLPLSFSLSISLSRSLPLTAAAVTGFLAFKVVRWWWWCCTPHSPSPSPSFLFPLFLLPFSLPLSFFFPQRQVAKWLPLRNARGCWCHWSRAL